MSLRYRRKEAGADLNLHSLVQTAASGQERPLQKGQNVSVRVTALSRTGLLDLKRNVVMISMVLMIFEEYPPRYLISSIPRNPTQISMPSRSRSSIADLQI